MDPRVAFSLFFLAAAACVSAQHDHHNHQDHRVEVTVYYESLCPDSIKFFTTQLYPALQNNLSSYIHLDLLPYGKSKTIENATGVQFECHHGPGECRGNKIQACALRLINQTDPTLGFDRVTTDFINCLMGKVDRKGDNTVFPTTECATVSKVNNLGQIENCANHPDGSKYLKALGERTRSFQDPLQSVPTVVFNGQFKRDDNTLAQTNFAKAVCQYIQGAKPEECTKNGATSLGIGSVLLVLAVVLSRDFF